MLPVDWRAAGAAAELFLKSLLLGIDHGLPPDTNFADPVPIDVLPFEEAVKYMNARLPMGKDEYYALDDKMRFRAFTVSRLADADAIERVQGFLSKSLEEGATLSDFRKFTNEELLDAAGMGSKSGWYWETVYRTNMQTAYTTGRAIGFAAVPPLAIELLGVDDTRQTPTCRSLTVPPFRRPYGDPVWSSLWPPFHFNCRTFPRAIYDQSELDGYEGAAYSPTVPDFPEAGWGTYPLDGNTWWEATDGMKERAEKAGIIGEIDEARTALIDKMVTDGFREASSIREAEGYAVRALGVNYADYRGIDLVTANDWNRGAYDAIQRFPELKEHLRFLGESKACYDKVRALHLAGVTDELKKLNPGVPDRIINDHAKKLTAQYMRKLKYNGDAYALAWPLTNPYTESARGITVGKRFGSNSAAFRQSLAADVAAQFHPIGCDTIRSVLDHEVGHKLDDLLAISKDKDILKLYSGMTPQEITEGISEYSWKNRNPHPIEEFVAEGWAEYCNNPNPRPIARKIGETIERRYAEWKKKNS